VSYYEIVAIALLCVLLNLVLNLKCLRKPTINRIIDSKPLISILVPARNEEKNIGACLESLCQQDYPNFEILVLDDHSTDATISIVEEIAARNSRVSLMQGQPLPPGWTGKCFACHQLAQKAKGDWFLFTDADTFHEPHMLQATLSTAMESGSALISGFPRQQTDSLAEQVAIPILYFILLTWVPFWLLQRSRKPKMTLAIGQFMFFDAKAYRDIGGHEKVKSKIVEDVALSIAIARHGMRPLALDLSPVVSTRMYQRISDIWEGFLKWMYSVATFSLPAFVALILAAFFLFLVPFLWLIQHLISDSIGETYLLPVVLSVAALLLMRWLVDRRFHQPIVSTLLHPLGISFMIAVGISGIFRRVRGRGVRWKGRNYNDDSGIT